MQTKNFVDIIFSYFKKGLKRVKSKLYTEKGYQITEPFVELEKLKKKFNRINIPVFPNNYKKYYKDLQKRVFPYSVNVSSPSFIGHMTSVLPSFCYDFSKLISLLNQNVVKIETSKSLTFLEREAIAILHNSFYNQPDSFYKIHMQDSMSTLGTITSNGTISNITALWMARNLSFPPDGIFKGIAEEGFDIALNHYGYQDSIILVSPLMHYSFEKAASLLGIGKKRIHRLPLTHSGIIDVKALKNYVIKCNKEKKHIIAIIGIAGATETGSIDPLIEMAKICRDFGIYFHVDAAFGGALIFSDEYKYLLNGIEYADSITICGHKQLYLPMGVSICLFRDSKKVLSIYNTANYQARMESFDFGKASLEGSRPSMSLLLHANLHLIGKKGYDLLIEIGIKNAQYLKACILKNNAFELIAEPTINIVNYRYIPKKFQDKAGKNLTLEDNKFIDEANVILQNQQFKSGKTFVSKTKIYSNMYCIEIFVLRSVLSNPLTTKKDINQVLDDQLQIASTYIKKNNESSTNS